MPSKQAKPMNAADKRKAHMTKRTDHMTQREVAADFGVSQSTVHRTKKALKAGFTPGGSAR